MEKCSKLQQTILRRMNHTLENLRTSFEIMNNDIETLTTLQVKAVRNASDIEEEKRKNDRLAFNIRDLINEKGSTTENVASRLESELKTVDGLNLANALPLTHRIAYNGLLELKKMSRNRKKSSGKKRKLDEHEPRPDYGPIAEKTLMNAPTKLDEPQNSIEGKRSKVKQVGYPKDKLDEVIARNICYTAKDKDLDIGKVIQNLRRDPNLNDVDDHELTSIIKRNYNKMLEKGNHKQFAHKGSSSVRRKK